MANRPGSRLLITTYCSILLLLAMLVSACGPQGTPSTPSNGSGGVQKGGTWVDDLFNEPDSLIPDASTQTFAAMFDQTIYAPLFYGDSSGQLHAGLTSELPTAENGGISSDLKTWTFKLRPNLQWSDGQPLNADDVDFTWKLWTNPAFAAADTVAFRLITSADVSSDKLSITFHLSKPYAPFIAAWADGRRAPLPKHHFENVAPATIKKSEGLNPQVVNGPFTMSESKPGDHYTVVRNPRYYRASEGLPYLDKVVFGAVSSLDLVLKQMQAGSLDATGIFPTVKNFQAMQRLKDYTLIYPPTQNGFEALFFNFHNVVLVSHLEVRQAMAMAVDQQTIIAGALKGLGTPLCTDHPSAYHPGYQPDAPCPVFDLAAAKKLLEDNGWVKGPDGVRTKG